MWLIPSVQKSEQTSTKHPALAGLFDNFINDWPFRPSLLRDFPFNSLTSRSEAWIPAVNILKKDSNLILQAELPGFDEKSIDLKLEGNVLTLQGERKIENESDLANYHRVESFFGKFTRSFTLPETVQADKIKADYKNGILTVVIPQKPEVQARQIPVAVNQK